MYRNPQNQFTITTKIHHIYTNFAFAEPVLLFQLSLLTVMPSGNNPSEGKSSSFDFVFNHPRYAIQMFIPSSLNCSNASTISGETSLRSQAVGQKTSNVLNADIYKNRDLNFGESKEKSTLVST
ncbi:hypothetical protein K435DRAFT_461431 [Dendrothele bispora CBS 962.96]|uniref:Uncharacterized protein n=1 Tax=Dendrothele bispora (strain CBS 962.96) TaxID=1314807 RepID=A0A4S8MDZ4_DENBC|nr:hypothetical protein K435DRAFT_461431 [Dendrothele bispora CBS 962.96]